MFGVVKPCRHTLSPELREQWRAHLCGQCLSLRDQHGQMARVTTNVDAIVLSVLVEAQQDAPSPRDHAGPCPLRAMKTASVVRADDPGILHGVAVSLSMASAKVHDHALDGDGFVGRVPRVATGVARRWAADGAATGRKVSFDVGVLHDAVADSDQREQWLGGGFDHHVAPTEEAAAAACAHTSFLADRPHNAEALREVGRMFGRITYLLDAVDDEDDDIAHGHFNALVAAYPDSGIRHREAARIFADAHRRLVTAFDSLDLPRPDLARALLVDQLRRAGVARFGHAHEHAHGPSCAVHARRQPRLRVVATLAKLGVLVGLQMPGFQPGVGPEGFPPQMPGMPGPDPRKQHWYDGCCDGCDCTDGCCCCCECGGCCDSCDCDC